MTHRVKSLTRGVKSSLWANFSSFSSSSGSSSNRSNSPAFNEHSQPAPVTCYEKDKFLGCFPIGCGNRVDSEAVHVSRRRIIAPADYPASLNNHGVRLLWADKHRPTSLNAFLCHTQQAMYLKQLVISENRPFSVQGAPTPKINVPINTSKYHVDINMSSVGAYDKDILPTIIKELNLSTERVLNSPVVSQTEFGYKVLVIHNAEKLSKDAQHTLRRLMDRYGDTCKLILCCNSRDCLDEGLRARCQVIDVEAPIYEEITRVLNNIAKKEDITLPKPLAARIAYHCRQNLRQAIVSLEACKASQYPFTNDQPVQIGYWEEDVMQIAVDMVQEPTPKRLFDARAKTQNLIQDGVPPVLILQKLLEELLPRIDVQLKRLVCQWASFYETRMVAGPLANALYQLEAFLAKFMSIYKSHVNLRPRQQFMVENVYSSPKPHKV